LPNKLTVGLELGFVLGSRTGIANYTAHMVHAALRQEVALHYLAFAKFRWLDVTLPLLEGVIGEPAEPVSKSPADQGLGGGVATLILRAISGVRAARVLHRKARQAAFAVSVRSQRLDLFHAFNYRPPADPGVPVLPVVYDLSTFRYPEFHPADRVRWLAPLGETVSRAPLVQTISEFSKREIVELFAYPAERIFVAPPAAAPVFVPAGGEVTSRDLAPLGLSNGGFFLAVGTLEPRKNIRTLIASFARLTPRDRARCALVVVGGKGWGDLNLPREAEALVREGSLRFLHGIANPQLRSLYEGARLLLMPSVYEGFGMPVVEALACGAPVAYSAGTSMEEIAAGLGRAVAAQDVEAWTEVLRAALESDDHADANLREGRIARARQFSWQRSAEKVVGAYRQLIST